MKTTTYSTSQLQKTRAQYYGALKRVESLETKKSDIEEILRTNRKPIETEGQQRSRALRTAERTSFRRQLAKVMFDLDLAKEKLQEKRYLYKKANRTNTDATTAKKQSYKQNKENKKLDLAIKYIKRAQEEGVEDFTQMESGKLTDDDIKRLALKAFKDYHNGMPVRNLSKPIIEKLSKKYLGENNEEPNS